MDGRQGKSEWFDDAVTAPPGQNSRPGVQFYSINKKRQRGAGPVVKLSLHLEMGKQSGDPEQAKAFAAALRAVADQVADGELHGMVSQGEQPAHGSWKVLGVRKAEDDAAPQPPHSQTSPTLGDKQNPRDIADDYSDRVRGLTNAHGPISDARRSPPGAWPRIAQAWWSMMRRGRRK
jgi:hypothetical protein